MTNPIKPTSPVGLSKVTPTPNKIVVDELIKAGKNAKGVLGMVAHAALVASAEFTKDKAVTNNDRVEAVFETYRTTLSKIGDNNIAKHFRNCLWLLLAPDEKLEITPPKGKASAVTMPASDIVARSSKALVATLAKDLRDANGVGRKVTPRPSKKPASFFELLAAALKDKEQLIKIKLTLAAAGYALTPITKLNKAQKVDMAHIVPMANKITDVVQTGAAN